MDVKLCDFGLSRGMETEDNVHATQYVATRYYRAPGNFFNSKLKSCCCIMEKTAKQ
jgi:serine/threonine protein kinase